MTEDSPLQPIDPVTVNPSPLPPSEPPGTHTEESLSTPKRLTKLVSRWGRSIRRMIAGHSKRRVAVILNPASGQGTPDLRLFNRIIHGAGYEWDIEITNDWGDGARLARRAAAEGAAIVAAYGGDGTVMDVATGLLGSDTPLAILPGGTGNALAKELNIPQDMVLACSLMVSQRACVRKIDLGRANDNLFLLRFGVGLEARIVRTADRSLKDRLGPLAYVTATVQAWNQAPISRYRLEFDGREENIEGLACMVANAGTLGIPGLNISPLVRIDDGLLDVFVIRRADLAELTSLAASVMGSKNPTIDHLPHWQCKNLIIHADPQQGVEADGEELGQTPAKVSVVPGALKVIAPG